jgi:hypothetical protein
MNDMPPLRQYSHISSEELLELAAQALEIATPEAVGYAERLHEEFKRRMALEALRSEARWWQPWGWWKIWAE